MKVNEAIEFIERYRYAKNSKTDEIIDLLKSLEAERDAYKGMWKMLSGIANSETDTSFESELFQTIEIIENHYLGGGE